MNEEIAFEALSAINNVLEKYKNKYPEMFLKNENAKKGIVNKKVKTEIDPLKILKRVDGIIKNYNEQNATRKLENLINLISQLNTYLYKNKIKLE